MKWGTRESSEIKIDISFQIMAMLAEPRRKQKVINLRAKNNAWSNDNTKFGQRMLEKMGWTSGKGLGANENGITEHVVARYKNDEKGLGFEDRNDQWTKHEDDFNSLLANLSNASDNTENLHSGISLEDKSKKSKARIHYHKFTRGKDISKYSEKDLANIFGKKSFKNIEVVDKPIKEDLKTSEQIFTEKGSMDDYFKNKMAQFKSKNKMKTPTVRENDVDYEEASYVFCGFSQGTDDSQFCTGLGYKEDTKSSTEKTNTGHGECDLENYINKKKKSKSKCGNVQEELYNAHEDIELHTDEQCVTDKVKKKKSKNKDKQENDEENQIVGNANNETTRESAGVIYKNKKSKKDKIKISTQSELDEVNSSECNEKDSSKNKVLSDENIEPHIVKKKKSKRKNELDTENVTQNLSVEQLPKKKKKKKHQENN